MRAESAPQVLLAEDAGPGELGNQLRAELRALGLVVETIGWSDAQDGAWRSRAGALLRVRPRQRSIEVWFAADVDVAPELVAPVSEADENRSIVLRATELARARLLPSNLADASAAVSEGRATEPPIAATAGAEQKTAPVTETVPRDAPSPGEKPSSADGTPRARSEGKISPVSTFRVGVGPSLGYDSDGFGTALRARIDALWFLRERFTLTSSLVVPTFAQSLATKEGRADLRLGLLELGGRLELASSRGRFRPYLGLSGGLLMTQLEGKAEEPLRTANTTQFAAAALAVAGGALRAARRLWIALDLRAGTALPRNVVRFAGREVGSVGRPLLFLGLSLEVPFG